MDKSILLQLPHNQFNALVKTVLKQFRNPQELLKSPFQQTDLIQTSLILGDYSDQMDRVKTVREVFCWAVSQIAPDVAEYPIGSYRSLDDPTWVDPAWQHYNILRHRYIEPITPDAYFEGSGIIITLMAYTGIPSRSSFYSSLDRAVHQVAAVLRQELEDPSGSKIIRQTMLAQHFKVLRRRPHAAALLGIAATFQKAIPRRQLLKMAEFEQIHGAMQALDYLISERNLIELEDGMHLFISPVLRRYVYKRQKPSDLKRRHSFAADYFSKIEQTPDQITHLQRAEHFKEAFEIFLDNWGQLGSRLLFQELLAVIDGFPKVHMDLEDWQLIQTLRGSHFIRFGKMDPAREIFTQLVHNAATRELEFLSLIFLAHLCRRIDPESALRYYLEVEKRIDDSRIFTRFYYSSRGRFHLSRHEIKDAKKFLLKALEAPEHKRFKFTSVLLFALTDLYLIERNFSLALKYSEELISYAESEQDAYLIALSIGMRGKVFLAMSNFPEALRYFHRSEELHRVRFNLKEISATLTNIGIVYQKTDRHADALAAFKDALTFNKQHNVDAYEKMIIHMKLAELYSQLDEVKPACEHWIQSYVIAKKIGAQQDHINNLEKIRLDSSVLQNVQIPEHLHFKNDQPVAMKTMDITCRKKSITSSELAEVTGVCRTKAYQVLTKLVSSGQLIRYARGRATRYVIADQTATNAADRIEPDLAAVHYTAQQIMEDVRNVGHITTKMVQNRTSVSRATAKRTLADLVSAGFLKRAGEGRGTRYVVPY